MDAVQQLRRLEAHRRTGGYDEQSARVLRYQERLILELRLLIGLRKLLRARAERGVGK